MIAPLPSAMPRKANVIHQQILSGLLANKTTTRTELRERRDKKGAWTQQEVPVSVPTLAGNVSEENVDRIARRWIR
ncbi:hypothetical protein MINTMi198_17730 [Mycobacterium intracellulare M.i.198]|uniref:hypothetical protein n=1 Tax=Mycobacterium intracellulare TaxID=1767 RepID=UPI00037DA9C4|nr:hypothetical protein [Mycobacterium intracellulare]BCP36403.1 hypothetical protein MINTMi198_17730 [Mycobacterium intracellulare M.i.198]